MRERPSLLSHTVVFSSRFFMAERALPPLQKLAAIAGAMTSRTLAGSLAQPCMDSAMRHRRTSTGTW